MKYQKGTFLIVPNKDAIRGLPPITQSVYLWICSFADDDGVCYPSLTTLAECAGCSRNSVIKAIEQLTSLGLLARTSRYYSNEQISNMYQIMVAEHEGGGSSRDALPSSRDALPSSPGGHRTIPINYNTILSTNVDNNSMGHSVPTEDIVSQVSSDQVVPSDSPPPVPPPPSPRKRSTDKVAMVNKALEELQRFVDELGLAYEEAEERKYMAHILYAKSYGALCDKVNMSRLDFAKNIVKASVMLPYLKGGVISGPRSVYQRYKETYNAAVTAKKKKELSSPPKPHGVFVL